MSLSSRLAVLALAILAVVACQPAAGPISETDRAAIGQVRESYRQAVLATDPAAIASVYTADGVEMPPNMPLVQGRDAIQRRNEPLAQVTEFQITPMETTGHGDVAFDRGSYTFTGRVEGMPEAIADTGKYLVIARKQPDGSWLIARAIWNSDLAAAMPPATELP